MAKMVDEAFNSLANATNILGKGLMVAGHIIARNMTVDDRESIKKGNFPSKLLSFDREGFIFGKNSGYFVSKEEKEQGHILVVGGSGSGKSTCLAIPTLLSWEQRAFVIDIKGELYEETRHKRDFIKVYNPLDPDSYGYDPFYALDTARNKSQEAREIALALIPIPSNTKDAFWYEAEQNFLTASILHFWFEGKSFIETMIAIKSTKLKDLVEIVVKSRQPEARLFMNQFDGMEDKILFNIYSGVSNKITVFATDPDVKASLSKSRTIKPSDIENGFDIFICIPEYLLEQLSGLLTLMITQRIKYDERRDEKDSIPTLYLLDEFPRLGKIEAITNALATLRSKNITICLMIQSLAQLDVIYGHAQKKVIADNCSYKAILKASEPDTQEYFSRLVGTYEAAKKSSSETYHEIGLPTSTSSSESTIDRRIIKPEEFETLPLSNELILLTPFGFMRVNKTYYKDLEA